MKPTKAFFLATIIVTTIVLLSTVSLSADKYPSRSIELVCGSSVGGGVDTSNRLMAKYLEKSGQDAGVKSA